MKTKVAKGDPYINSDYDEIFLGNRLPSKGNSSGDPRVFFRISCFWVTLILTMFFGLLIYRRMDISSHVIFFPFQFVLHIYD